MNNTVENIYLDSNVGERWESRDGVATLVDMDLDKIAWTLRNNGKKITQLEEDLAQQLEKLKSCTQLEIEKIRTHSAIRHELAFSKMKALKIEKKHFPGVGKFSIGKVAESINTKDYDGMTPDQKARFHNTYPTLFSTKEKIEVKPNKNAIKEKLKAKVEIPSFSIDGGNDILKFKEE